MSERKKINVAVLMGGQSSEHNVSMASGCEVVRNISTEKYNVLPVVVSRDGSSWKLVAPEVISSLPNPLDSKNNQSSTLAVRDQKSISAVNGMKENGVQVVFLAMHGPYGEDGTMQGMLELTGIPYTGSGVLTSALGMNKIMFRKVLAAENLPIPRYVAIKRGEEKNIEKILGKPPYFVKPYDQGSSVGASIVQKNKNLAQALDLAYEYSETALVDEYVKGKELTCAVLGNNNPHALPVIEIVPKKGDFFNYDSKYSESGADEIVPARISEEITKRIQSTAIEVYKLIGCRGFGRIDFILRDDGSFIVLEVNTIPGLTSASLLPKAAKAAGIEYPELIDKLISLALEKTTS